jgi:predicted alpha-1,6-mannanase (GH76 family)
MVNTMKTKSNKWLKSILILIGSITILIGCDKDQIVANADSVDLQNSIGNPSMLKAASIESTWPDQAIDGFNDAFLATDAQGNTYYRVAMNTDTRDETWTFALDIQAMEDVYERTGSDAHRNLVNDLVNGFLVQNPAPYDWDGWNDDIAWMGLATIRAHHITGHAHFLEHARYCFDYVWERGWDTQYNDGGIWEQQPDYLPDGGELIKEALSNNPTGRLAALIYQSTGDQWYLDRAHEIYNWSWNTIFNWQTGEVYRGIYPDGSLSVAPAAYNQGSFVAFADVMHEITGDPNYLRDARRAVDYTIDNLTVNGILVQNDPNADTWGDEMARGLGMLCTHNPELWDVYGDWMVQNANAIWSNRRTDYNLTWNAWNQHTPENSSEKITHYISAIAWLQYTPVSEEAIVSGETYSIISKSSGKAMDVSGAA